MLLVFTCFNIIPVEAIAAETNLVVNGSFEEPPVTKPPFPDFPTEIPGWKLSKAFVFEIQYGLEGKPYDGKQLLEMDGTKPSKISQDIPTEEGNTYKLSFAFSPRPEVSDNKLNVYWGETLIDQLDQSGEGLSDTDWVIYSYSVKAIDSSTRLSFDNFGETNDGKGSYLDAVSVEPLVCELGDEDCTVIIGPEETVTVPVKIQIPEDSGTLPLDLILTQDLTSSFTNDLPVIKNVIPDLVTEVKAVQPNTNFGLASFTDKKVYGTPSYYVYETELPLTSDSSVFEQEVADLAIVGGGTDFPESSLSALMQVALRADSELGFRDDTRRIAIVSTDDAYKKAGDYSSGKPNNGDTVLEESEDYPSVAQAKQAIYEANMLPVFLVTSGFISTYNDLVSQLGVGAVVELENDSSNLVEAVLTALDVVNQNLTIVVLNDDYGYVESVEPDQFENVAPGSEVTTYVTFKYSGLGSGEQVTIRALGIGDLVIDVQVVL